MPQSKRKRDQQAVAMKAKPRADHPDSAEAKAKLAAQRRRHALHQEASVRRKQQQLQAMRDQVSSLEQLFEKMCREADQTRTTLVSTAKMRMGPKRPSNKSVTSIAFLVSQPEDEEVDDEGEDHHHPAKAEASALVPTSSTTSASLYTLAREIHHLQKENAHLRDLVEQQVHFKHLMRSMMTSLPVERPLSLGQDIFTDCDSLYNPFTVQECQAMVQHDYEHHVIMNRPDFFDERINKKLVLGWRGSFTVGDDAAIRFQLTKKRPMPMHVDLDFLMDLFWKSVVNIPAHVFSMPVRVEVLQRISDDIVIIRRTLTNTRTGREYRSVGMMYRMKVNDWYLVGCIPLPKWGSCANVSLDHHGKPLVNRFYSFTGPCDVPKNGGPVSHVRLYRWGISTCYSIEEAEVVAKELLYVSHTFENLIAFQADQKLI